MSRGYGTDPKEWGRPFWKVMYTVAKHYSSKPSPSEQTAALNYYASLVYLLPCDECKKHFAEILEKYPIQAGSRKELKAWLKKFELKVKQKTDKGKKHKKYKRRHDYDSSSSDSY